MTLIPDYDADDQDDEGQTQELGGDVSRHNSELGFSDDAEGPTQEYAEREDGDADLIQATLEPCGKADAGDGTSLAPVSEGTILPGAEASDEGPSVKLKVL